MDKASVTDPSRVLSFGREKLARTNMTFAGIAGIVGILAILADGNRSLTVVGWGLVVFAVGWGGWELSRMTQAQKPILVLSPDAIFMRIEGAVEFAIPWSEVRGIDAIDIAGSRGGVHRNVTVVLVDREFYDRVIHVGSFIRRGPGWNQVFLPLGDLMQVALHHEILPVDGPELLAAVEARYRAFSRLQSP